MKGLNPLKSGHCFNERGIDEPISLEEFAGLNPLKSGHCFNCAMLAITKIKSTMSQSP